MSFLDELQKATNKATTENGGVTNASSLNPCLDFFALGASKRNDINGVIRLFSRAYAADKITALRILFYIRDVRGGQGERDIFRACIEKLENIDPQAFDRICHFIPEYGRWDDLVIGRSKNPVVVQIVKTQLALDKKTDTPSLLAKWMPSENTSSKATSNEARAWAKALGMNMVEYRKTITRIRKKIHLLEQDMSARKWNTVQYEKIPSQAFRKHTKAFYRYDKQRFKEFLDKVNNGEASINASTVTTAEVLQNIRNGDDASTNAIWKSLDNFVPEDLNAIVVADVSGSMIGGPMDISTSLALYFAERNKGVFANKFMTFSSRPKLVETWGHTLTEKLDNISTADWGMDTNIEAVFDTLLTAAISSGDFKNMPKVVYIISDMEFDSCVSNADETAFENARNKWGAAGLELPTIVFWNVSARSDNVPVTKFDKNVVLVSGSSQSTFRYALVNKSPEEIMFDIVNGDRYIQIRI